MVADRLKKLRGQMPNLTMVFVLIGLVVVLSIAEPAFLNPTNLIIILKQISVTGIMTMGMCILLIMGAVDLSAGPVVGLSCVCTALAAGIPGIPIPFILLAGVAVGTLFGFVNGFIYAKGKIPPFIVTLGTSTIASGLSMVLSGGQIVQPIPAEFAILGGGSFLGIPYPVLIFAVAVVAVYFLLKKTGYGRKVYAIGGNEQAAAVAGIRVENVRILAYVIMGMLSGLAGAVLCARLKCAPPGTAGVGYELDAIASSVIGGISFNGGIGSSLGAVIGILIIGTINNGLDILNVASYYQKIVKGIIIIIAVLLDRQRAKSA